MSFNFVFENVYYCPCCGSVLMIDFLCSISCLYCGYGVYYNLKFVVCVIL